MDNATLIYSAQDSPNGLEIWRKVTDINIDFNNNTVEVKYAFLSVTSKGKIMHSETINKRGVLSAANFTKWDNQLGKTAIRPSANLAISDLTLDSPDFIIFRTADENAAIAQAELDRLAAIEAARLAAEQAANNPPPENP